MLMPCLPDRHYAPDKPPRRIVASQEEDEDDEDEERYLDLDRDRQPVQHDDDDLRWLHRDEHPEPGTRSPVERQGSGSDGSGRTPPLQVPLGADEDDEEDDYIHEHHRKGEQVASSSRRATAAREGEVGTKRAAMQDILAARIPQVVIKRAAGDVVHARGEREVVQQCVPGDGDKVDFMALVRLEAERQRSREPIDRLGGRPSKDLETKFNGFKFKKVRKAGEGGFSLEPYPAIRAWLDRVAAQPGHVLIDA